MHYRHFNAGPLTPVAYTSTYSIKLSHRRLPMEVHIVRPEGETCVYVVGAAEARGVELAAEALGLHCSVVVLVPGALAA